MEKTIFEQMGGTYSRVGDYMLPNLLPPKEKTKPLKHWLPLKRKTLTGPATYWPSQKPLMSPPTTHKRP